MHSIELVEFYLGPSSSVFGPLSARILAVNTRIQTQDILRDAPSVLFDVLCCIQPIAYGCRRSEEEPAHVLQFTRFIYQYVCIFVNLSKLSEYLLFIHVNCFVFSSPSLPFSICSFSPWTHTLSFEL